MAAVDRTSGATPIGNSPSERSPEMAYGEVLAYLGRQFRDLKELLWETGRIRRMEEDLVQLREGLETIVEMMGITRYEGGGDLAMEVYRLLVKNGVSKLRAARIITDIKKDPRWATLKTMEEALSMVEAAIGKSLPTQSIGAGFRRVKAFVGPTGVGKSTTVAKLAARYHLDEHLKTGLITTDTYRIGAVEQLRTYAKILGIPLQVARNREEFQRSVTQMSDRDVILVDTPGKPPHDGEHRRQLKEFFSPLPSVTVHLLLNPSVGGENLLETAELYRELDFDEYLFTKVDECRRFGALCDVLARTGRPVGFITNGQNVPEDIVAVSPAQMAKLIVRNSIH
ncbi:MAG: hypothetical protein N2Z74_00955 [Syntrophales bacterium]|nr:hypothetical protein [Syntrophales bacterium]